MPVSVELELNVYNLNLQTTRRRLFDLLVPGSFPDQYYRVGREVIKIKVDFKEKLTHENVSKRTVGREVKIK